MSLLLSQLAATVNINVTRLLTTGANRKRSNRSRTVTITVQLAPEATVNINVTHIITSSTRNNRGGNRRAEVGDISVILSPGFPALAVGSGGGDQRIIRMRRRMTR